VQDHVFFRGIKEQLNKLSMMKQYTHDLLGRINNEIQVLDLEEDDIFKKSLKATSLLGKA
jgi:hypothetical protein